MLNAIVTRWYGSNGNEIGLEIYHEDTDHEALRNFWICAKAEFNHSVIADEGSYIAFSDGTRVEGHILPVVQFLPFIEKPTQPLQLESGNGEEN